MKVARNPGERSTPIHPGEFLREDFMKPLGLSASALAAAMHVPSRRVSEIARERRDLNTEMMFRLAQYFRMSPDFWMQMQTQYDLRVAEDRLAATVRREVTPRRRNF
jgi:addiction module HigA family antidote